MKNTPLFKCPNLPVKIKSSVCVCGKCNLPSQEVVSLKNAEDLVELLRKTHAQYIQEYAKEPTHIVIWEGFFNILKEISIFPYNSRVFDAETLAVKEQVICWVTLSEKVRL